MVSFFDTHGDLQFEDWVVTVLPVRLHILTGRNTPRPGMEASQVIPSDPDEKERIDVWLWSHQIYDGAGNASPHFTYVCQACGFKIFGFMAGKQFDTSFFYRLGPTNLGNQWH